MQTSDRGTLTFSSDIEWRGVTRRGQRVGDRLHWAALTGEYTLISDNIRLGMELGDH